MKIGTLVTPAIAAEYPPNTRLYVFANPSMWSVHVGYFIKNQVALVLGQTITETCILMPEGVGWVETECLKIVNRV